MVHHRTPEQCKDMVEQNFSRLERGQLIEIGVKKFAITVQESSNGGWRVIILDGRNLLNVLLSRRPTTTIITKEDCSWLTIHQCGFDDVA